MEILSWELTLCGKPCSRPAGEGLKSHVEWYPGDTFIKSYPSALNKRSADVESVCEEITSVCLSVVVKFILMGLFFPFVAFKLDELLYFFLFYY